mmetsp:Transcript_117679/g.337545  ORF Transcript_117679/g.337545 Transcript_117679/m.337545 type:complete len:257 (+) Transcript_117679:444-1214(+)
MHFDGRHQLYNAGVPDVIPMQVDDLNVTQPGVRQARRQPFRAPLSCATQVQVQFAIVRGVQECFDLRHALALPRRALSLFRRLVDIRLAVSPTLCVGSCARGLLLSGLLFLRFRLLADELLPHGDSALGESVAQRPDPAPLEQRDVAALVHVHGLEGCLYIDSAALVDHVDMAPLEAGADLALGKVAVAVRIKLPEREAQRAPLLHHQPSEALQRVRWQVVQVSFRRLRIRVWPLQDFVPKLLLRSEEQLADGYFS